MNICLANETIKASRHDRLINRWLIELLGLVEFMPARHTRGMIMADVLVVGLNSSHHVTLHDLHVVDIL